MYNLQTMEKVPWFSLTFLKFSPHPDFPWLNEPCNQPFALLQGPRYEFSLEGGEEKQNFLIKSLFHSHFPWIYSKGEGSGRGSWIKFCFRKKITGCTL